MSDKYNLIIPMVTDQFNNFPIEYQYNSSGVMNCVNAISGLPLNQFTDVYFVISKQADYKWHLETKIKCDISTLVDSGKLNSDINIKFVRLEKPTKSQVDTIYDAIIEANIDGYIFIKDADNFFTLDKLPLHNTVCIYSIEDCSVFEPQHKSYVSIDDNMIITNIIEKRVISKYFNCGGYIFKDTSLFIEAYNNFKNSESHVYLSHLIYFLMLVKNIVFTPEVASNYSDFILSDKYGVHV